MPNSMEQENPPFTSKRQLNKAKRKEGKAKSVLLKHENIKVSDVPTKMLYILNAGLGNGLSREHIYEWLSAHCISITDIIMLQQKPYCFVVVQGLDDARKAIEISGTKVDHNGIEVAVEHHIYYVAELPQMPSPRSDLPSGLILLPEFISEAYEKELLSLIEWGKVAELEQSSATGGSLKHRSVKHFGYEFKYTTNNVSPDEPLEEGIPSECGQLLGRLKADGLIEGDPDQLTVNKYKPGQGIPPHVDTHSAFRGPIVCLSLGSQAVMTFAHPEGDTRQVTLPRRSLLVMTGESRYLWTHGIVPRKTDVIHNTDGGLTLSYRETRVSYTFRTLRRAPCDCEYPQQCDSQNYGKTEPTQSQQIDDDVARKLEQVHVHKVYDTIASHFSGTRHSQWPRVREFIECQPAGSILADIGCGNGKYLTDAPNPSVYKMGFERSWELSSICQSRGFPIAQADCLATPLRDNTVDVCLCIAVIHHLSTPSRRKAAIRELLRILRPGGQCLIYVWAMEQKGSTYLKNKKDSSEGPTVEYLPTLEGECQLPVHKNKTQFAASDMLVPWNLKVQGAASSQRSNKNKASRDHKLSESSYKSEGTCEERRTDVRMSSDTSNTQDSEINSNLDGNVNKQGAAQLFHRYYHIFREGELEKLCLEIEGCEIIKSYFDQGNWCVILTKR